MSKVKRTIPKVFIKQKKKQRMRLREFVSEFLQPNEEPIIVMDDECYFTTENVKWCEKYYYEQDGVKLTRNSKFIEKSKFPIKVMVWIAISRNGRSEPVFFKGVSLVNTSIYVEKC